MTKSAKARFLPFLLIVLIAVSAFSGCAANTSVPPKNDSSQTAEGGAAATQTFTFEVTNAAGEKSSRDISTEEQTVGAALLQEGLIAGDTSDYGLMVTSVNGEAADYAKDKAYWAFYVDGEYAVKGVDATPIEPGKTYSFVYTRE